MYIYASLVLAADWLMAAAVAMRMRAGYISARDGVVTDLNSMNWC